MADAKGCATGEGRAPKKRVRKGVTAGVAHIKATSTTRS
jgi:hypothetical protein